MVELESAAKRAVKGYSTGMKQRLALAAALLGDPEVLILDEPANGLDPEGMLWLRTFLRKLASEGRTVLVSSHVLAEVEQTVDDILIMSKGQLLAQGPIQELTASTQPVVRVRSPQAEKLEAALTSAGAAVNRLNDALAVRGPSAAEVGDLAHAAGVAVHELLTEQPRPRGALPADRRHEEGAVIALARAELLKLRSTRTALGLFIVILVVTLVPLVLILALVPKDWLGEEGITQFLTTASALVPLVLLVFGILGMTNEYRHGTITYSYLVTPRRWQVMVVKLVVYLLVGMVTMLVAMLLVYVAILVGGAIRGVDIDATGGSTLGELRAAARRRRAGHDLRRRARRAHPRPDHHRRRRAHLGALRGEHHLRAQAGRRQLAAVRGVQPGERGADVR